MNQLQLQTRLLKSAAAFLFIFAVILTLAPSVRERTWSVDLNWTHWIGFAAWAALTTLAHRTSSKRAPDSDALLLPVAALLAGWGLLTIFRLDPSFGLRQTLWLTVSTLAFIFILRLPADLNFLRRYKYVALALGLLLTALTLLFGTNPAGFGPRLWLGGGTIYLQPSEPLKLLLVAYLAAYLADYLPSTIQPSQQRRIRNLLSLPFLVPTLLMTGLSLLILLVQRDLGTASIFLLVYALILYLATGKKRIPVLISLGLILAGLVGYYYVDIIHLRISAWLNPWADPSGRSYQIIQSLLAIANGGLFGRGPGIGAPTLVPVALSDFIFAAIAEETGLLGAVALLALLGILLLRGLRAALNAPDSFQRLLAAGITCYLAVQSLLILGGNLRLLPLTGVTLPFVSYGGSSLLTAYIALALLIRISAHSETEPAPLVSHRPYTLLASLFGLGLIACALSSGWWAIIRAPDLLARTDNPRRSISDFYVQRGALLDRANTPITISVGESGSFSRKYLYQDLASVIGYTQYLFGQAGLEATLDEYLRGTQGNPASLVQWNQLLYGTPPAGLDVRLSIDLNLQTDADAALGEEAGALILLNAQSGEILVMASHPTYDPNLIGDEGLALLTNDQTPLVNRAAQGVYTPGALLALLAGAQFDSASPPNDSARVEFIERLGFYNAPALLLPVADASLRGEMDSLRVSPLQVVLAAASLSNDGVRPAPRIALAVNTLAQGWVILPTESESVRIYSPEAAQLTALSLAEPSGLFWKFVTTAVEKDKTITWFIAGTLPNWQGTPLTIVVLLERSDPQLAQAIGLNLLRAAVDGR